MSFSNEIKTILKLDDKDWKKALKSINEAEKQYYKESAQNTEKLTQAKEKLSNLEQKKASELKKINEAIAKSETNKTKAIQAGNKELEKAFNKRLKLYKQQKKEIEANSKAEIEATKQTAKTINETIIAQNKYNTVLNKAKERHSQNRKELDKTKKSTSDLTNSVVRHLRQIETLVVAYYTLSKGFQNTIGIGIQVSRMVEDNTSGIAALLSANTRMVLSNGEAVDSYQKFTMGLSVAKNTMEDLRKASILTYATFPQLTEIFQQAIGQTLSMGDSFGKTTDEIIQNTIKLSQRMSNIAGAIGMPMDRVREEIRSILSGNASTDSLISTMLFGSPGEANKAIRLAKERGENGVKDMLDAMLKPFDALATQKTFTRSLLALEDAWKNTMMKIVKDSGAFKDIQSIMDEMTLSMNTNIDEITRKFDEFYAGVKLIGGAIASMFGLAWDVGYEIGEQLRKIVESIKDVTPGWMNTDRVKINKEIPEYIKKQNKLYSEQASLKQAIASYEKAGLDSSRLKERINHIDTLLHKQKEIQVIEEKKLSNAKNTIKNAKESVQLLTKIGLKSEVIDKYQKEIKQEQAQTLTYEKEISEIKEKQVKAHKALNEAKNANEIKTAKEAIKVIDNILLLKSEKLAELKAKEAKELAKEESIRLKIKAHIDGTIDSESYAISQQALKIQALNKEYSILQGKEQKEAKLLQILEAQTKLEDMLGKNKTKTEQGSIKLLKSAKKILAEESKIANKKEEISYYDIISLEAQSKTVKLTKEEQKEFDKLISQARSLRDARNVQGMQRALYEYNNTLGDTQTQMYELSTTYIDSLDRGFTSFFDKQSDGWLNWSKLGKSVINDVVQQLTKTHLVKPAVSLVSGITSSAADSIGDWLFSGWSKGGYTPGDTKEIAGVVHGGEYVAPASQVQQYPQLFKQLDSLRGKTSIRGVESIPGVKGYFFGGSVSDFGGFKQQERELGLDSVDLGDYTSSGGSKTSGSYSGFASLSDWQNWASSGNLTNYSNAVFASQAKAEIEKGGLTVDQFKSLPSQYVSDYIAYSKDLAGNSAFDVIEKGGITPEQFATLTPEHQGAYFNWAKTQSGSRAYGSIFDDLTSDLGWKAFTGGAGSLVGTGLGSLVGGQFAPLVSILGSMLAKKGLNKGVEKYDFLADIKESLTSDLGNAFEVEISNITNALNEALSQDVITDSGDISKSIVKVQKTFDKALKDDALVLVESLYYDVFGTYSEKINEANIDWAKIIKDYSEKGATSLIDEVLFRGENAIFGKKTDLNLLPLWQAKAEELGTDELGAIRTYSLGMRDISKYGLSDKEAKYKTSQYAKQDLEYFASNMGVNIANITVDNFMDEYRKAISKSFTPETFDNWKTLSELFMRATDAQKEYAESVSKATDDFENAKKSVTSSLAPTQGTFEKLVEYNKSIQAFEAIKSTGTESEVKEAYTKVFDLAKTFKGGNYAQSILSSSQGLQMPVQETIQDIDAKKEKEYQKLIAKRKYEALLPEYLDKKAEYESIAYNEVIWGKENLAEDEAFKRWKKSHSEAIHMKIKLDEYKKIGEFYKGGYTGNGNPTDIAGIVHKSEYVVNHQQLQSVGGVNGLEMILNDSGGMKSVVKSLITSNKMVINELNQIKEMNQKVASTNSKMFTYQQAQLEQLNKIVENTY